MIDSFEHKGIWWLPDNEDEKIEGILKFSVPDGQMALTVA